LNGKLVHDFLQGIMALRGRDTTMRPAGKIAESGVVRVGELQANTRPLASSI
jgi:hypothetical protein